MLRPGARLAGTFAGLLLVVGGGLAVTATQAGAADAAVSFTDTGPSPGAVTLDAGDEVDYSNGVTQTGSSLSCGVTGAYDAVTVSVSTATLLAGEHYRVSYSASQTETATYHATLAGVAVGSCSVTVAVTVNPPPTTAPPTTAPPTAPPGGGGGGHPPTAHPTPKPTSGRSSPSGGSHPSGSSGSVPAGSAHPSGVKTLPPLPSESSATPQPLPTDTSGSPVPSSPSASQLAYPTIDGTLAPPGSLSARDAAKVSNSSGHGAVWWGSVLAVCLLVAVSYGLVHTYVAERHQF